MKLNKIHHTAIICSNYEKSKNFYVNILGLKIINEAHRKDRNSYKLDLKVGDCQLELFSFDNPPKRQSYPEACGLRHLCFEVNDINEAIHYLNNNGITTEDIRIDEVTQCKFTFFNDPDNLPIELYEVFNI